MKHGVPYASLFRTFLRIGSSSFSLAMAAAMKQNIVERRGWLQEGEMMEGLALAQTLPGPTFVLLSAYVGNRLKGVSGAVISVIGFILPSFVLMTFFSWLYFRYNSIAFVDLLFRALSAIVIALILNAVLIIGKSAIKKPVALLIVAYALAMTFVYNNVFAILIGAAALGMVLFKNDQPQAGQPDAPAVNAKMALLDIAKVAAFIIAFFLLISLSGTLFTMGTAFFRIGLFVFGNGYTMLPLIQQEVVNVHGWLDPNQFLVGVALGQITPGPVTITSVFIGFRIMGLLGAVVAIVSMYLPALLLVVAVSPVFNRIRNNRFIRAALSGLNAAFVGLMVYILYRSGLTAFTSLSSVLLAAGVFAAMKLTKIDTIWIILCGAALYVLISLVI